MFKMSTTVFLSNLLFTILLLKSSGGSSTINISEIGTMPTIKPIVNATIMSLPKYSHIPLVQCHCSSGEVMDHTGQCQSWTDGTTVPVEPFIMSMYQLHLQLIDTTELNVIVNDIECQHHQIDLQEDQFILRERGDIRVTEGDLRGLRVADYCVNHTLIEGQIKLTAKGCVSTPEMPRCCPLDESMIDDNCGPTKNKYMPFNPLLAIGPDGDKGLAGASFPWNDSEELIEKPNCTSGHIMKKVKLDGLKAYLAVLYDMVYLTWQSEDDERQYRESPDFCVDVPRDINTYYAYYCQRDLEASCKNKTCTNKCCPEGEAFSMLINGCVPSDVPFEPAFPSPPPSLTILHGFPTCELIANNTNFNLLQEGTLHYKDATYHLTKFCMETFIRADSVETGALVCIKESTWHIVRGYLLPVCMGFTIAFLALMILLHAWIPELRKDEGKYPLFHAASLFVAFSVILILQIIVPKGFITRGACVSLAFVKQFALLSSFFWINIMCFNVWRLFRNLVRNNSSPDTSAPSWILTLYAFGVPFTITVITIMVHFRIIPWLVHTHIGEVKCWFRSDKEMLLYYYGPIAIVNLVNFIFIGITYYYVRIIRADYRLTKSPETAETTESTDTTNGPSEHTVASIKTTIKHDSMAVFWNRFYLLFFVSGSWLMEVLSWAIPPEDLWFVADILYHLQGICVFFVFLTHHNIRVLLKEKLPKLLQFRDLSIDNARTAQTTLNYSSNHLSNKVSSSTIVSKVSSLFSKGNSSTSSFNLNKNLSNISTHSTDIRPISLSWKSQNL